MNPAEHLAVPYVVTMEAVPGPGGRWLCRAVHPELPGVAAEHPLAIVALEQLEAQRIEYILGQLERGAAVPVPRPPLAYLISEFEALLDQQPSLNRTLRGGRPSCRSSHGEPRASRCRAG